MNDVEHQTLKRGDEDVLVLTLRIRSLLPSETITRMKARIADILRENACPLVVLDLSSVEGWNSEAFGMLLTVHKRMAERNGHVRAAGLSEPLARTYSLCGLDRIMPLNHTVAQAIEAYERERDETA